jgi:predicted nucleic acid-binding protein
VAVIIDSSVLIDHLGGVPVAEFQAALSAAMIVLSPLVIAEMLSGNLTIQQRETLGELLQDYPLHETPLAHWIDVGSLRRLLRAHGINATIPDAHVAQCALDLDATLLTRDEIFTRIASHTPLRLGQLR